MEDGKLISPELEPGATGTKAADLARVVRPVRRDQLEAHGRRQFRDPPDAQRSRKEAPMTHSPDDLVARLRLRKPGFELSRYGHVNPDGPEAADRIEQQEALQRSLFDAIQHGDEDHRAWLKEALDAHFAGQPVPEPRGGGRKEAELKRLREALPEALEADERISQAMLDNTTCEISDEPGGLQSARTTVLCAYNDLRIVLGFLDQVRAALSQQEQS